MTRKLLPFLLVGLVVLSSRAFEIARAEDGPTPKKRPNILLLMTDQQRGDAIGADGNKVLKTPNIDRLAAEGVRFRCAYSSTPSCTPARAALLTGLAPWNHGMLGYSTAMGVRYKNEMPRMLAEAGYRTAGIGKMHFHPQRNGHGFETMLLDESGRVEDKDFISDYRRWFKETAPHLNPDALGIGWNSSRAAPYSLPPKLHPTQWTGDRAVEFIEQYDDEKPFFLKVSFARPHSPYDPPEKYWKRYDRAKIPPPAVGDWCQRHAQRDQKPKDDLWQGDLGPDATRRARQGYYAAITFIDDQIGRILDALRKRGALDDTLIVFLSDHGDMLGDHHLWRKTYGFEGSARIPMILRWGNTLETKKTGLVFSEPVELRDVLPTFLDAAGVEYDPKRFDGRSLLDLVRSVDDSGRPQPSPPWREFIDLEHSQIYAGENNWTGLTDGKFKYIYYTPDNRELLFDLVRDPNELRNLAEKAEYRKILETWRNRMILHLEPRGERYVKDGKLVPRQEGIVRSPHYPR